MKRGNRHGHVPQVQATHQEERQSREARLGLGAQDVSLDQSPREEDRIAADRSSPARSSAPAPPTSRPRRRLQILSLLVACTAAFVLQVAASIGAPAWKSLAPLAAGPRQETAVVALGGRIYVLGGFDRQNRVVDIVEAYDPTRDRWEARKPLPMPLHHANAAVVSNKLYVVGALTGMDFRAVGVAYEYDAKADAWTPRTAMPPGTERGAAAVMVVGSRIYVAGGLRGASVGDFSSYDTATDRWESLPPMPGPRDHLVGGVVKGILFAVGGRGPAVGLTGRVDAFDPSAKTWSVRKAMPTARAGCAAGVIGDRIIVAGGEGNRGRPDGVFVEVEAYDASIDTWKSLPPMLTPRHGTGGMAVGGKLYVPGGATREGFGATAVNESLDTAS
jgi:N-acetylneuraminic acid mutarotase